MKNRVRSIVMILILLTVIIFNPKAETAKAGTREDTSILLDQPAFHYYIAKGKENNKKIAPLKLTVKSSKTNGITDEENWIKKNKLSLNTYEVPNSYQLTTGNLPEKIDTFWGDLRITAAFYDKNYIYCTYGSDFSEGYLLNIYDYKTKERLYSLDFSNYRYSPDYIKADFDYVQQKINWAAIQDGILYVSNSHNTYAKSSKNQNAYITAIDLTDMSVIWRTDALVSNSNNFMIVDNVILCGYGFTDEKDYLYQINRNNGKILKKTSVKSAISYMAQKGNLLYVRTYNTDYVFKIGK